MLALLAGVLLLLTQGPAPLPPSGVRSGVSLAPAPIMVGAPVTMTVRIQVGADTRVIFPPTVDSSSVIEPLDPVLVRDTLMGAVREFTATYRLVAWQTGRHVIPIAPVRLETGARVQQLALGDPVLVVESVLPADTTLRVPRGARDILALPSGRWAWWWLLLAFALVVVGGGWWLQRRSRGRAPVEVAPIRAAESAFAALHALDLPAIGEAGRHAVVAAAILRTYLAERDPRAGRGLTTAELALVLREQTAVPEYRVTAVLHAVDAMQFAPTMVESARAVAYALEARAIIDEVARLDEQAAALT
jgi:hypothetical protein